MPGWVELEEVDVAADVVDDELVVDLAVDVELRAVEEELLVVEETTAEALELAAEVEERDAPLLDVLSEPAEEAEAPTCVDVDGGVLLAVVV